MNKITLLLATLMLLILTACGGGDTPSSPTTPTTQERAIDKIEAYAQGTGSAPSVQDYLDAGVTGVTADNLNEINAVVAGLTQEDVDTKEEIQALVNGLGVQLPEDTTPPVITLQGENMLELTIGEAYSEPGATAEDAIDGVVSVTISGSVDITTVGEYTLTYYAEDSSGNHTTVTRTITVVPDLTHIATVKQTGVRASYDIDGNEVTDGSLKDDGYYQSGTEPAYTTAQDDSIILDSVSDLVWTMEDRTDLETIDDAIDYCEHLALAGYDDWRVPTALELLDITDYDFYTLSSYSTRAHNERGDWWISTTYEQSGDFKSYYHFDILKARVTQKGYGAYGNVKCVRGTPLQKETFSRDDVKELVTTSHNHLMWQDNSDVLHSTYTWNAAIDYCESLSLGSYTDWRLPTQKELLSLVNYAQIDDGRVSGIATVFENKGEEGDYFYSSTPYILTDAYHNYKGAVDTFAGVIRSNTGSTTNRVRCVRNTN